MKKFYMVMALFVAISFSLNAQIIPSATNVSSLRFENPNFKYANEGRIVKQNNHPKAKAVIFSETFGTGVLPVGWSTIDNATGGIWEFNNPGGRTINTTTAANGFAIFDSDNYSDDGFTENADLITPEINCSALTVVKLSFEHYYNEYSNSTATVSVSGDNGNTWTVLQSWTTTGTANAEVAEYDISAIAAGHSQVKIKWNYVGDYAWYWAVDDVKVYEPEAHDLAVTDITPSGIVPEGSTVAPVVQIFNNGASSEAMYSVFLTDSSTYAQTVNVSTTIAPGNTFLVTFPNWTPAVGNYTLTAIVTVALDANSINDTLTQNATVATEYWTAAAGTIPFPTYLGASAGYFDGTNHFLYSIGGNDNVSGTGTNVSIYNVETEAWSTGAAMPDTSIVNSAVTVGSYIYVLQGSDGNSVYSNGFYKYDIAGNSWSTLTNLPIALGWTNLAELNGNIYCVGGVNSGGTAVNTVYRYNISSNSWTTASAISTITGIFGGSLVVADNKLIYIQGIVDDLFPGSVFKGVVDGVNPDLITWTNGTACPTGGVFKIKADVWTPCSVIYTGGNTGTGGYWSAVPDGYIYDVVNDTWTPITDKTTPALGYAAASFVIGSELRYYSATGYDDSGAGQISNVEYFKSPLVTDILTFNFNALTPAVVGTVDVINHTITLTVPEGTDVTALVPSITLPCGATISPLGGDAQNFTDDVIYTVTAQGGIVTQPWTVIVDILTGVNDLNENEKVTIYPNPANDVVNVKMNATISQIEIINLDGQLLLQSVFNNNNNEVTVNTSGLNNGIYFLRIVTSDGAIMKKFQIIK